MPGHAVPLRPLRSWGTSALRTAVALALGASLSVALANPGVAQSPDASDPGPAIVVTTPMLGWAVSSLAGGAAQVAVLVDAGADPHAWEPSARDVEALYAADLVVANGSGLEEQLDAVLDQVRLTGVPVFEATDHVTIREVDDGHDHAGGDPHFWTDPLAMRDVVGALATTMAEAGIDVGTKSDALRSELDALDAEVRSMLALIPPERRRLVTGHESLGYFADRYGFDLTGAVIPGLSSQGDVSARELADLTASIREAGVTVVFAEAGTPASVAEAVASETGARVIEVALEQLPEDGSYATFMHELAATITEAMVGDTGFEPVTSRM